MAHSDGPGRAMGLKMGLKMRLDKIQDCCDTFAVFMG
jgi:hypothetical protein